MMTRAAAVRAFTDEFLATGEEANTIRTIWYQIKHQIQPWQKPGQTEADFSEAVTETIGAYLWTLFNEGDVDIYERLDDQTALDTIQAAVLRAKLPFLAEWTDRRRQLAARYNALLAELDDVIRSTGPR